MAISVDTLVAVTARYRQPMFGLLRWWRRRNYRSQETPETWSEILITKVPFFGDLDPLELEKFLSDLRVFVHEKHWIGAGGMEITEEVKVVIGAAAVRLALRLPGSVYNRLTEIIVYPSHYKHPDGGDEHVVFGEAHSWGTVVLSWDAVLSGLSNPNDGHDTATHEFAHVLDRGSGAFDGTPILHAGDHYRAWAKVMSFHYLKLRKRGKAQRRVIRNYGATNEVEFFAVATESFFEKPDQMKKRTPDLYAELSQFYGFDPAEDD